jgi:hypothetical protein
MYYEEVFAALNKAGVRYLVVGGVAVVIYGVLRLTADLDLMVDLESGNLKKFLRALEVLGYKPKLPVRANDFADPKKRAKWIADKNMKMFSFFHPQMEYKVIDVFIDEPISFAVAFK